MRRAVGRYNITWFKRNFEYEVEDVFSLINGGVVVVGHVRSGTMHTGDRAVLLKGNGIRLALKTRIGQMETRGAGQIVPLKKVSKGEPAGVFLEGVKKEQVDIGDRIVSSNK